MSILTGMMIRDMVQIGEIGLTGGNPKYNPASVNLTLAPKIGKVMPNAGKLIDPRQPQAVEWREIGEHGIVLQPGSIYLGSTVERVAMGKFAGFFTGRSSFARMGIEVEFTAGYIDPGFVGNITAEIAVVHPTIIFAGMELFQLVFYSIVGDYVPYAGKYQAQNGATESREILK